MSVDRQKGRSRRQAELEKLAAMSDDEIDTSDAPELKDWSAAEIGKFYRPLKKQITLRLDADVIAWFRAKGAGYQSEINRVLRAHVGRKRER